MCRRETTEVKCNLHHIMSRIHAINMNYYWYVNLVHLVEVVFVHFLYHNVTLFFPSFHTVVAKRESLCESHTSGVESYILLPGNWKIYIKLFSMGDWFVYSLLFIYLLTHLILHLYQYELTDINFVLCVIIQYYATYVDAPILPASAIGGSYTWLLCPIDRPP